MLSIFSPFLYNYWNQCVVLLHSSILFYSYTIIQLDVHIIYVYITYFSVRKEHILCPLNFCSGVWSFWNKLLCLWTLYQAGAVQLLLLSQIFNVPHVCVNHSPTSHCANAMRIRRISIIAMGFKKKKKFSYFIARASAPSNKSSSRA